MKLWHLAVLVAPMVVGGCAWKSSAPTDPPPPPFGDTTAAAPKARIKLTYESESGRLNLLAGGAARDHQVVSYQQAAGAAVPEFTQCRLVIQSPHPQGRVGYALAQAQFVAKPESSGDGLGAVWNRFTSTEEADPAEGVLEAWSLDVPEWQVDALVKQLREQNFFRRQREVGSEVKLSTEIDGDSFGKSTRPIAELDALLLRARREGRLVHRASPASLPVAEIAAGPELRRLPPVVR